MKLYKTVLLVDDDPITNFINYTTISNVQLAEEIPIVANGKKALEFLEIYYLENHALPDVIILDINMPVMDGFEFLEEFEKLDYENKEKTLIIVLSNIFRSYDLYILNMLGYPKYLSKPMKKNDLMSIINTRENLTFVEV